MWTSDGPMIVLKSTSGRTLGLLPVSRFCGAFLQTKPDDRSRTFKEVHSLLLYVDGIEKRVKDFHKESEALESLEQLQVAVADAWSYSYKR